jgi:hypothetical protein
MFECLKTYNYLLEQVFKSLLEVALMEVEDQDSLSVDQEDSQGLRSEILLSQEHMEALLTPDLMEAWNHHDCRGIERLACRDRVETVVQAIVNLSREEQEDGPAAVAAMAQNLCLVDRNWARLVALADHKCEQ